HWVMQTSLLKTLARKHKSTLMKMASKHRTSIETAAGPRTCIQVVVERSGGRRPLVAAFGGIPLRRQRRAVLTDRDPSQAPVKRRELIGRLLAGICEICGQRQALQAHQIRKLADLGKPGEPKPEWMNIMTKKRRKTLVVCRSCHDTIHRGQAAEFTHKSLESPLR
uniref:HNH endonuclease n=1 Tax=Actinomadura roseirufa TaxID=2094049 RepID=UPI001F5EFF02